MSALEIIVAAIAVIVGPALMYAWLDRRERAIRHAERIRWARALTNWAERDRSSNDIELLYRALGFLDAGAAIFDNADDAPKKRHVIGAHKVYLTRGGQA